MIHPAITKASKILDTGEAVYRDTAMELASLQGEDALDLVSLANKVRNRFSGPMQACSIVNAKSGMCAENCRFCAQSLHHDATVQRYKLLGEDETLARARAAFQQGVRHFGIVTSGKGYPEVNAEFESICRSIMRIHAALPDMGVCASLGILGEEPVQRLASCGIRHYNINLQVAPQRYADLIADTHAVEDRVATVKRLREAGISVCCGAIFGVGETMEDRVELAFVLQDLDVAVIPLNVLIPIEGTPLQGQTPLSVEETAAAFSIFRLVHPTKVLKFAAGRETLMKDFQGLLMLAGMNGMLTGGYLTTRGRDTEEDRAFVDQLSRFGA